MSRPEDQAVLGDEAIAFDDGSRIIQEDLAGSSAADRSTDASLEGRTVAEKYAVGATIARLLEQQDWKRVALQLPDESLGDAAVLSSLIEEGLLDGGAEDALVFVLGDTTFGSCCVDEVAAFHLGADVVVHYGKTCFTRNGSLPVLYVLGRRPLDVDRACAAVAARARPGKSLVITYDVYFWHAMLALERALQRKLHGHRVRIAKAPTSVLDAEALQGAARMVASEEDLWKGNLVRLGGLVLTGEDDGGAMDVLRDSVVVHIGASDLTFDNILLAAASADATCYVYDPSRLDVADAQRDERSLRLLGSRYAMLDRVRDAEIVGILVGTLGADRFREVVKNLQRTLENAGKRTYTFALGRPKPEKLANFPECDAFVMVACQEQTLALNQHDYDKPIVTPLEVEIALEIQEWTGRYSTSFEELRAASDAAPAGGEVLPASNPTPSAEASTEQAIVKQSENSQALAQFSSPAAVYLAQREYKGLKKEGPRTVRSAQEGSFGRASSYTRHGQNLYLDEEDDDEDGGGTEAARSPIPQLPPAVAEETSDAVEEVAPPIPESKRSGSMDAAQEADMFSHAPALFDDITSSDEEA